MASGGQDEDRVTSEEALAAFAAALDVLSLSDEERAAAMQDARDRLARASEQMDEMPLRSAVLRELEADDGR